MREWGDRDDTQHEQKRRKHCRSMNEKLFTIAYTITQKGKNNKYEMYSLITDDSFDAKSRAFITRRHNLQMGIGKGTPPVLDLMVSSREG